MRSIGAGLTLGVLLSGSGAPAQDWYEEPDPYYADSEPVAATGTGVSARGAVGLTADPSSFLLGLGFPIDLNPWLAFTPHIQLGFDDEETIVAPTLNLEYHFDLRNSSNGLARRLHPYIQGGLGFAYIHKDRRGDDDDEVGFLLAPGLGLEFDLTENLALGSNVRFNVLPSEVSGENFFLSWEFVTLRVKF